MTIQFDPSQTDAVAIHMAPVDKFSTACPKMLFGQALSEIKAIQASILRYGLLSPIIVAEKSGQLIVIDGRKRLAAIRRLRFFGELPRSLVRIPYVFLSEARMLKSAAPALMTHRELYETVMTRRNSEMPIPEIAAELFLSVDCIRQILTLSRLSPKLRQAFFDNVIDLQQARAYASLPVPRAQDALFDALGPFADGNKVMTAITALQDDNVTTLVPAQRKAAVHMPLAMAA